MIVAPRFEGDDAQDSARRPAAAAPPPPAKARLRADKAANLIVLDDATALAGVPPEARAYRLGNRGALERVLDRREERRPKDPTIAARLDAYRFADHEERVADLLARGARGGARPPAGPRPRPRPARPPRAPPRAR